MKAVARLMQAPGWPLRVGYNTQSWCGIGKLCNLRLHFASLQPMRRSCAMTQNMHPSEVTKLIEVVFDNAIVKVESDDNTHFSALIVATEFDGLRPLARHQLIYKPLGARMGNEIHALSITALTPDEWRQQGGAA